MTRLEITPSSARDVGSYQNARICAPCESVRAERFVRDQRARAAPGARDDARGNAHSPHHLCLYCQEKIILEANYRGAKIRSLEVVGGAGFEPATSGM
jgi:ribosomal protein L32